MLLFVLQIQPTPDGSPSLHIISYSSKRVNATNVTVVQWVFPKADNNGRISVEVSQSKMLQEALSGLDTADAFRDVSELDIVSDVVIDPEDWPAGGVTLNRDIILSGVRLRHRSLTKTPLLDLKMVSGAVKIAPGAVVELNDLEVLNLALGPLDEHFGFLMYFFDFNRCR